MSGASNPKGGNGDRPVLVLGAKSDMARAIARALAERGHPIQLAARSPEDIARDAADLTARYGVPATCHAYDAEAPAEGEGGAAGLLAGLPAAPSIAICAVGFMPEQEESANDPALGRRVIAANFTGPAQALEMIAGRMHATGLPCAVVGISSVAGDRGRAKNYVYGAAKAGFSEWLSGMRQKYAASKVQVLTVKPGFVNTAMTAGMDTPAPLTSQPEDVAKAVLKGLDGGKTLVMDPKWRLIMAIITHLPEKIFMKTKF
ncbi:SDR family NAD(P)-dependent oxidoreductase [Rhodovulum sp. DZ06]|uniref:SDR family NAD(P)-dependent oxidoreductase n=1 Tax=Rhodovulum sp. DZ06 TaxID=3425126 RepID=UPI003D337307